METITVRPISERGILFYIALIPTDLVLPTLSAINLELFFAKCSTKSVVRRVVTKLPINTFTACDRHSEGGVVISGKQPLSERGKVV